MVKGLASLKTFPTALIVVRFVMMSQTPGTATSAPPREYSSSLLNAALFLAAISGILHAYVGYVVDGLPNGAALILIAIVYFIGAGLLAAKYKRDLILKIGPVWVVLVIVLWALVAVMNIAGYGARDPAAYAIKVDEVALLGVLFQLRRVTLRR